MLKSDSKHIERIDDDSYSWLSTGILLDKVDCECTNYKRICSLGRL